MADKTFIVSHPNARSPITITGANLHQALEDEGLDPAIWKEIRPAEEVEDIALGDNQGDDKPEDN
jgi:hypothetical protein